jgi:hypothetical protein
MPVLSRLGLRRVSAFALVLCYVWLSAFGSFLHECVRPNAPSAPTVAISSTQTHTQDAHESHAVGHTDNAHSCSVCEWQMVNTTPALPVFVIVSSFSLQQRVITTFPRYLKTIAVSTSSRAPPLA